MEVQDTGVGIAPSDLERIFLPYEQAERRRPAVMAAQAWALRSAPKW